MEKKRLSFIWICFSTICFILLSAAINRAEAWQKKEEFTSGFTKIQDGLSLEYGLKIGHINGDTVYEIRGPEEGGWKSRLKFPMNNYLMGGKVSLNYNDEGWGDYFLNLGGWISLTKTAGKMEDSDWLYAYSASKTIYSESDAGMDVKIFDGNILFNFLKDPYSEEKQSLILGARIGYKYQKFDYDISNTTQIDYIDYSYIFVRGKTLDYEVEYKIPYLGLNGLYSFDNAFKADIEINYSPWVKAEDKDDHLLRDKLSKGNCEGSLFMVGGNLSWEFKKNWTWEIGVNYTTINTQGKQRQYFYDGPYEGLASGNIDDKINSNQLCVNTFIKYCF